MRPEENQNKSLMAIVNQSIDIEKMLIESGGEVNEEIEKFLTITHSELAEKVDGYQNVIERFEALEDHYKARAEFFRTVSGQCKTVAQRLKDNIKYAMQEMGVVEIKGNDIRFKLSPTKGRVIIEDANMVPVEFKEEVIETKIDDKKIREALEQGEVRGARLEPGFSLRTYANVPERKSKEVQDV